MVHIARCADGTDFGCEFMIRSESKEDVLDFMKNHLKNEHNIELSENEILDTYIKSI